MLHDTHDTPTTRMHGAERRLQLIEVAIDLFSRKGFKGTTTKEIANAAGVTEALIFRHFANKEQLYEAIIDSYFNTPRSAAWFAELQACMDRNDDEALLRHLITVIIEVHRVNPKFERLMLYAALEGNEIAQTYMRQVADPLFQKLCAFIARRQSEGAIREGQPELIVSAVVGLAHKYAESKYILNCDDGSNRDDEAVNLFTRIAMDGVRPTATNGRPQ